MDPVRNPYAPGAGQRPPELAGRDRELGQFEVVLERIARGRPERSMVLTGLRGVGKTVLLNSFRSMALQRLWGTGKIEARPEQSIRRPVAAALHMAVRELAPRHRAPDQIDHFLGVLKAFASRDPKAPKGSFTPHLGIDVPAARGRADSGDLEIDLTELFADAASVATDLGVGIALFIDEMQDVPPVDVSALCAATHELSQTAGPLIVVGAGLPHLPAVLSASKSYSERLFRYVPIDRLDRAAADQALIAPARREGADFTQEALDALYEAADGYPYFVQAYGKVTWDAAAASPVTEADVTVAGRRRSPNWRWASSAAAMTAPPRPNVSTCGPWHCWATIRCRPLRSPTNSAASRRAFPRPGTALSRRGLSTVPSAGLSLSPCRTSASSCEPSPPEAMGAAETLAEYCPLSGQS